MVDIEQNIEKVELLLVKLLGVSFYIEMMVHFQSLYSKSQRKRSKCTEKSCFSVNFITVIDASFING